MPTYDPHQPTGAPAQQQYFSTQGHPLPLPQTPFPAGQQPATHNPQSLYGQPAIVHAESDDPELDAKIDEEVKELRRKVRYQWPNAYLAFLLNPSGQALSLEDTWTALAPAALLAKELDERQIERDAQSPSRALVNIEEHTLALLRYLAAQRLLIAHRDWKNGGWATQAQMVQVRALRRYAYEVFTFAQQSRQAPWA